MENGFIIFINWLISRYFSWFLSVWCSSSYSALYFKVDLIKKSWRKFSIYPPLIIRTFRREISAKLNSAHFKNQLCLFIISNYMVY